MLLTKKVFRSALIEVLKKNGLNVYFNKNGHFILIHGNDSSRIVNVELIYSKRIDSLFHGSHNDNKVDGIGHFKFNIPKLDKINYYVFAFLNTSNHEIEFVIVPDEILHNRFQNQNRIPTGAKKAELTLWLMDERFVYEAPISFESEWYFMSSGVGGRMVDGGKMDYSEYLNNWRGVIDSVI